MKIIITGASGQYGRLAVDRLLAIVAPQDLILITRRPEKLAELAGLGVEVRRGDFDDPESLVPAFAGGERMLLISGTRVGARVAQHKAAIDAAAQAGVKHVVYTSLLGIHPDNPAIVVKDHAPTEDMLRASGMAWTALRDAQYADAVVSAMAPLAVANGRWPSATGTGRMPFVAREDCVASAVAVLTGEGHANRTYDITGPELLTFAQAMALVSEVAGAPVVFESVDAEAMYAMFDAMGVPREPVDDQVVSGIPWNSDDMVTFELGVAGGFFETLSNDVERLTGRPPQSLRSLLEANRAAFAPAAQVKA